MATYVITPSFTAEQIQDVFDKYRPTIIFEPGIYDITVQIRVKSYTYIIMYGATLRRSAVIQSIFISFATGSTIGYLGAKDITIDGGEFEGMGSYSGDNLMTFFHAQNINLFNITFLDAIELHHLELNSCKNVRVSGCRFFGYKSNPASTFREAIQIDFAGYSELVIAGTVPTSACYDLTCCENVTIEDCIFDKSDFRPSCNVAIGSHSQPNSPNLHRCIKIKNNVIHGGNIYNQYGLNINNMKDVLISGNTFYGFSRAIRLVTSLKSYNSNGTFISNDTVSAVEDVTIVDNTFYEPSGTFAACGVYSYSYNEVPIKNVKVKDNTFVRGNNVGTYCVYLEDVDVGIVSGNICGDYTVRVLDSSSNVLVCDNN